MRCRLKLKVQHNFRIHHSISKPPTRGRICSNTFRPVTVRTSQSNRCSSVDQHSSTYGARSLSFLHRPSPPCPIREASHKRGGHEKRLQHSQAVTAPDGGSCYGEDGLAKGGNREKLTNDNSLGILSNSVNDTQSYARQIAPPTTISSEDFLQVIGRHLPSAVPITRFNPVSLRNDVDDFSERETTFQIEIENAEYKILCSRAWSPTENSDGGLDTLFEDLAHEYTLRLMDSSMKKESSDQVGKQYNMHTLYNMLEIDPISVDYRLVELRGLDTDLYPLFSVQAYSGYEPLGQPQVWTDIAIAERLARASANADILKRAKQSGIDLASIRTNPDVRSTGSKKKRSFELQRAKEQPKPRTYSASISQQCLSAMVHTLRHLRSSGLPDVVQLQPLKPLPATGAHHQIPKPTDPEGSPKSTATSKKQSDRIRNPVFQSPKKLPIRQGRIAHQLVSQIEENDVMVLVSETGSGKTTQLPQILLERALTLDKEKLCNIICTQPRRIAATSVATRVAQERHTYVGGSVGYQVRFDHKVPSQPGSINYSTAGVLLKRLQDDSEEICTHISHIIVDEIHERDLTVDLLLAFLRDLMRERRSKKKPFPKIILMSATMEYKKFERYFEEACEAFTPRVTSRTIPGRLYPVSINMLEQIIPLLTKEYAGNGPLMSLLRDSREYLEWEDEFVAHSEHSIVPGSQSLSDTGGGKYLVPEPDRDASIAFSLMTATIAHILRSHENGDILVFLPGMKEIDVLASMLESRAPLGLDFSQRDDFRIFKLHSALYETNTRVFEPVPEGCRRIILATNIAQTSITLPDVVHVVDSGKRREMKYDQVSRRNDFTSTWIDQATSLQRRGRAGRVQSGYYWAMFTEARFQAFPKTASPEILISDLATSSLILKSYSDNIDLGQFFCRTPDPPSTAVVHACIQELKELAALTVDEKITPMGKFCSDMPLHPAKARGLLYGLLFGCLKPLLIVASHDVNSPLIYSLKSRKQMFHSTLTFAHVSNDDRYAFVRAFIEYDDAVHLGLGEAVMTLESNNVRRDAYRKMLSIGRQLCEIMAGWGLLDMRDSPPLDQVPSVFQVLPAEANQYADCINLFKALALSVVDTNVAVWDATEQSWLAKDIKCMLRPYGVNTMESLKLLDRAHMRKAGELVGFSDMIRNAVVSPRPFLVETSSITPLTAMLFGGPIAIVDDSIIEIDGWLRYKVDVADEPGTTSKEHHVQNVSPATVILELRKALDRFTTLAFADLRNQSRMTKRQKHLTRSNQMFFNRDFTASVRDGLMAILEADVQHHDDVIHLPQH